MDASVLLESLADSMHETPPAPAPPPPAPEPPQPIAEPLPTMIAEEPPAIVAEPPAAAVAEEATCAAAVEEPVQVVASVASVAAVVTEVETTLVPVAAVAEAVAVDPEVPATMVVSTAFADGVVVPMEGGAVAVVSTIATTSDAAAGGSVAVPAVPKHQRLKRKQMADMDEEQLARRAWCLKCKADGKSRYSWAGSRTDARNGLRKHMKSAHSMTMDQAKVAGFIEL